MHKKNLFFLQTWPDFFFFNLVKFPKVVFPPLFGGFGILLPPKYLLIYIGFLIMLFISYYIFDNKCFLKSDLNETLYE